MPGGKDNITFSKIMRVANPDTQFDTDAAKWGREHEKKVKEEMRNRGEDAGTFKLTGQMGGIPVSASPDLASNWFGKVQLGEIKARGKPDPNDIVQMGLAAVLAQQMFGRPPEDVRLILGRQQEVISFRGEELVDQTLNLETLVQATNVILSEDEPGVIKVEAREIFDEMLARLRAGGEEKLSTKRK